MIVTRTLRGWAALFLAVAAASCASAGAEARTAPEPEPSTASTSDDADELTAEEIEALYRARTDSARMRFTEADVRFMTGMIGHHTQALVMAGLAPTHGASPQIRTLAARIINAQRDEIATMERWLRDRDQPVPEVEIAGLDVRVAGAAHAMHMPGMLTPEQMRELDRARGAEFDRLFLTYMIQHHGGAVTMVRELFRVDGAGQDEEVFRFATDVQVDQLTEIRRMESMLSALSTAEAPS